MYNLLKTLGSIFSRNPKARRFGKPSKRPTTRPYLEILEDRLCPAGTWYWSPHALGNWSTPGKWKDANGTADTQAPQAGDTCVFDPNKSQFACVIDQNTNAANVVLQNGYTEQFQVNDGVTWHIANFTDNSPARDSLTVQYKSNQNTTQVSFEGTDRVYNFGVSDLGTKGQTAVNNFGTLTMGAGNNNGNNYNIQLHRPLIVSANATLNIGDSQSDGAISRVYCNDDSNITIYGTLNFYALKDKGATLLDNRSNNGYIDVASSQAGNGNIVFINTDPGKDFSQTISMGILEEAGSVKVTGDYWFIYNYVNNGQAKLYSTVISGGTFTLGNKGSSDGVMFSFSQNFLMDQWNNKGGNGFLDVVQNSKLTANVSPDEIDLNNGSLTVEPDVLLTSTRMIIANAAGQSFSITMSIDPTTNGSSQITMGTSTTEYFVIGQGAKLKVLVNGGGNVNNGLIWTLFLAPNYNGMNKGVQGDFPAGNITFPANVSEVVAQGNNTWQCQS